MRTICRISLTPTRASLWLLLSCAVLVAVVSRGAHGEDVGTRQQLSIERSFWNTRCRLRRNTQPVALANSNGTLRYPVGASHYADNECRYWTVAHEPRFQGYGFRVTLHSVSLESGADYLIIEGGRQSHVYDNAITQRPLSNGERGVALLAFTANILEIFFTSDGGVQREGFELSYEPYFVNQTSKCLFKQPFKLHEVILTTATFIFRYRTNITNGNCVRKKWIMIPRRPTHDISSHADIIGVRVKHVWLGSSNDEFTIGSGIGPLRKYRGRREGEFDMSRSMQFSSASQFEATLVTDEVPGDKGFEVEIITSQSPIEREYPDCPHARSELFDVYNSNGVLRYPLISGGRYEPCLRKTWIVSHPVGQFQNFGFLVSVRRVSLESGSDYLYITRAGGSQPEAIYTGELSPDAARQLRFQESSFNVTLITDYGFELHGFELEFSPLARMNWTLSPNGTRLKYPESGTYARCERRTWLFELPFPSSRFHSVVVLKWMQLETCCDYLSVSDATQDSAPTAERRFTGELKPRALDIGVDGADYFRIESNRRVNITLFTDGTTEKDGFELLVFPFYQAGPVSELRVHPLEGGHLLVRWQRPLQFADSENEWITGHTVRWCPASSDSDTDSVNTISCISANVTRYSFSYQIGGLESGTAYNVSVKVDARFAIDMWSSVRGTTAGQRATTSRQWPDEEAVSLLWFNEQFIFIGFLLVLVLVSSVLMTICWFCMDCVCRRAQKPRPPRMDGYEL